MTDRPDDPFDRAAVVPRIAGNLAGRYAGAVDADVIERCVHESFDELATSARVGVSLPVLTERNAAERLDAPVQRRKRL